MRKQECILRSWYCNQREKMQNIKGMGLIYEIYENSQITFKHHKSNIVPISTCRLISKHYFLSYNVEIHWMNMVGLEFGVFTETVNQHYLENNENKGE